jgi:hypothetical protein
MYLALVAVALISGHIVQDARIWGGDAVSRHDDALFIEPGTVRLATANSQMGHFAPSTGPEFDLPLPPVSSLDPVAALPRLPMLSPSRLMDVKLSSFDIPTGALNAHGSQCSIAISGTVLEPNCPQSEVLDLQNMQSLSVHVAQQLGG